MTRGVWKDYNTVNAAVNHDAWANELLPCLEPLAKKYTRLRKEHILVAFWNRMFWRHAKRQGGLW
jgi:hypothetical protein